MAAALALALISCGTMRDAELFEWMILPAEQILPVQQACHVFTERGEADYLRFSSCVVSTVEHGGPVILSRHLADFRDGASAEAEFRRLTQADCGETGLSRFQCIRPFQVQLRRFMQSMPPVPAFMRKHGPCRRGTLVFSLQRDRGGSLQVERISSTGLRDC